MRALFGDIEFLDGRAIVHKVLFEKDIEDLEEADGFLTVEAHGFIIPELYTGDVIYEHRI